MSFRSRGSGLLLVLLLITAGSCTATSEATCTGQTVQLRTEDVLTVGVDFAYPPFAFDHPDTREPAGFEVDLSKALAQQMGVKLLLVSRTSAALIPGLLAHRHDLAASGLLDAPSLRREACVSVPYLDADLGLMARAGTPPSIEGTDDLDGRVIGVAKGGRGERWARDHSDEGLVTRSFETSDDLLTALRAQQVDGIVDDLPVLQYTQVRSNDVIVVAAIETGDSYVLAAGPDNLGLVELVNDALERLRRNGKLAALRGRWFGE